MLRSAIGLTRSAASLIILVSIVALLLIPVSTIAASFDGRPKILLHVMSPAMKNVCGRAQLSDCRNAVTAAATGTPSYVYLLAAKGPLADFAGMEVGLSYQNKQVGNAHDQQGLDIISWTSCATLEFPTPSPAWPEPGSGNLLSWNTDTVCQTGETAVAGYFYVNAYSADMLRLIRRPASGLATVADCAAVETHLEQEDLGTVVFSAGGSDPGCNPCVELCPDPTPPQCEVTPTAIDFGTTASRDYSWRYVTVRNTGGGIVRGQVNLSSAAFLVWDARAFELYPYQSYRFRAVFTPPIEYGTYTAQIDLGTDCPPIPLTATYVPPIRCRVFPEGWNFGFVPVGQTSTIRFVVTNEGTVPFSGQVQESCEAFSLSGGTTYALNPGQTDTFFVNFTPPREGYFRCVIDKGGPCSGYPSLVVEGNGGQYVPPDCRVEPQILDFGPQIVGKSTTWSFGVAKYAGSGCIDINPDITCHYFRWVNQGGQMDACGWWFIPVDIQFTPGEPIAYECSLSPASGCPRVILRGEGRLPGAGVISPDSIDFGTVAAGSIRDTTIVLTNTGGTTITGSLDEFCGEFAVAGNAAYSLAPGQSATYHIQFQPNEQGSFRCVIDGGANSSVVPCTGTATEGAVPVMKTTWSEIKTRHR